MEHSYKPRLKPILKQHHFNVNRAQMNRYSCTQILISVHLDRFAYMQNLRMQIEICTWSQPGANFKNLHMVQLLHTCANPFTWTNLHT